MNSLVEGGLLGHDLTPTSSLLFFAFETQLLCSLEWPGMKDPDPPAEASRVLGS